MPVENITIDHFLTLSKQLPVLDVRSPQEYLHGHLPGAFTLPLFTNEQRQVIGTAYKKESRQIAVNIGLNYFSGRMKKIPGDTIKILADWKEKSKDAGLSSSPLSGTGAPELLVHCWRGGMRSESVAWLLNLYGYKIYVLKGGYKSFRNWALAQFEKTFPFKILGGYTGSGKTGVLKEMQQAGKIVIDLEGLANHKGSAFGALGEKPQPTQEMFENLLALELWKTETKRGKDRTNIDEHTKNINDPSIWLEDESRNIGIVNIPKIVWEQMRTSPLYFLEIPFEERLNYIVSIYGNFSKKELVTCVMQLQKRLGGLETKNAISFLSEDKVKECFSILMQYYDKVYSKALHNREDIQSLLKRIPCGQVDVKNAVHLF